MRSTLYLGQHFFLAPLLKTYKQVNIVLQKSVYCFIMAQKCTNLQQYVSQHKCLQHYTVKLGVINYILHALN